MNCGEDGVLIPIDSKGIEFFFVAFPVPVTKLDIKFYQGVTLMATIYKVLEEGATIEANRIYDLVANPNLDDRTPWTINSDI